MNKKLQQLRDSFRWIGNRPNIYLYGQFRIGLTIEEIKDYLRVRANKLNIDKLFDKFCDIAGSNTYASFTCDKCKAIHVIMYHHDVERFADNLFDGTPTFFD